MSEKPAFSLDWQTVMLHYQFLFQLNHERVAIGHQLKSD